MADEIKIHSPSDGADLVDGHRFLTNGRAELYVEHLTVHLVKPDGAEVPQAKWKRTVVPLAQVQMWTFHLDPTYPLDVGEGYSLTVKGMLEGSGDEVTSDPITFDIVDSSAGATRTVILHIDSHVTDQDITAQAGLFVAYGRVENFHAVDGVWMNDIEAIAIIEDPPAAPTTWTAFFDPLPVGVYTLLAVDSRNHSRSVSGLHVDQ